MSSHDNSLTHADVEYSVLNKWEDHRSLDNNSKNNSRIKIPITTERIRRMPTNV
jgi:hypothetical protein